MKTETTATEIETPLGTLYVAVRFAREDSWHDSEQGYVTEMRPRVFVSSSPDFEADTKAAEHWTIRGREYGVQAVFYFQPPTPYNKNHWHADHKDWRGDGYLNDRGIKLDWSTATSKLIDETVRTALDTFAAEHPDWAELSKWLRLAAEENKLRADAIALRRQADKMIEQANAVASKATPLYRAVSPKLLDTVID